MYGKLVNGRFEKAPYSIICNIEVNGVLKAFRVSNPSDAQYTDAGYLPVTETEYPSDGGYYELVYTERDGTIYGKWTEAQAPDSVPTLEERLSVCEDALIELAEGHNESEKTAKIYAGKINLGKMELGDVPERWREFVSTLTGGVS